MRDEFKKEYQEQQEDKLKAILPHIPSGEDVIKVEEMKALDALLERYARRLIEEPHAKPY
jgi:hypothetical protein